MDIIINRGKIVKLEELPSYSIAIDGFVMGPQIDSEHHRYSLDHHGKCLRSCTVSSCFQAWQFVQMGLNPELFNIYINDVDSDTCMAIWCLKNPSRCSEPAVQKLVFAINITDMHAGAIPINGMTKTVEWICAPETDSKRKDDYYKISEEGLHSILEAVLHRIDLYVNGEASLDISKQQKHGEFKILRSENDWMLIESSDPHIYSALYQAGFDKIVLIRPQEDKSLAVSLAKRSDFIENFPLEKFYEELNKLEPGWGGSSSCGGAPRNKDGSRSKLSLEKIISVIDNVILSLQN